MSPAEGVTDAQTPPPRIEPAGSALPAADPPAADGPQEEPSAALPDLPLEVIEAVCIHLRLEARVSLTACCRTVWVRSDVAASAALWGDIELGRLHVATEGKQRSLRAWLARHACGLRRVRLRLPRQRLDVAALLGSLAASPRLRELQLSHTQPSGGRLAFAATAPAAAAAAGGADSRLAPLQHLTSLASLDLAECGLRALPQHLGSLTQLSELRLCGNSGLAGFQPLEGLAAGLRRLRLSRCGLGAVPPQLAALVALAELDLSANPALGASASGSSSEQGGEAAFEPLRQLGALSRLDISSCGLGSVPPQLAALPALAELRLAYNEGLGEGAVRPLQRLTALTCLDVACCPVQQCLPAPLAALAPGAAAPCATAGHARTGGSRPARLGLSRAPAALALPSLAQCSLLQLPTPTLVVAQGGFDA